MRLHSTTQCLPEWWAKIRIKRGLINVYLCSEGSPSSGLPGSSTPWPTVEDHLRICVSSPLEHLGLSQHWCDLTWEKSRNYSLMVPTQIVHSRLTPEHLLKTPPLVYTQCKSSATRQGVKNKKKYKKWLRLFHDLDFSAPSVLIPWGEFQATHFHSQFLICFLQNRQNFKCLLCWCALLKRLCPFSVV